MFVVQGSKPRSAVDTPPQALKVAVLATSYYPWILGGAERSLQELCEDLAFQGHDVQVLCLGPKKDGDTVSSVNGVTISRHGSSAFKTFENGNSNSGLLAKMRFHLGDLTRLAAYKFLRRKLKEFGPDVVHLNNLAGLGWLSWLATRSYPTVQTLRDYYLFCLKTTGVHGKNDCRGRVRACAALRLPFRFSMVRPTLFVGVSDRMLNVHHMHGSLRGRDSTITIYNQPTIASVKVEQEMTEPLAFGMIGRIGAEKGTWVALEAFAAAQSGSVSNSATLTIAGSGPLADIDELLRRISGMPTVAFIGETDAASFFKTIDILLMPTQWEEPFGRSAAEALLCKVVLLASSVGGLPEVTQLYGGRFNLVSSFSDVEEWAKGIEGLAADLPIHEPAVTENQGSVSEQYLQAYRTAQDSFKPIIGRTRLLSRTYVMPK